MRVVKIIMTLPTHMSTFSLRAKTSRSPGSEKYHLGAISFKQNKKLGWGGGREMKGNLYQQKTKNYYKHAFVYS